MQERGLHVDAEDHPKPDQVDAEVFGGRPEQRDHDEGQLEEIEEEGKHEDEDVDEYQEADLTAGQGGQQVFNPDVAIDAVEGQREHARADQDEDHERRQLRRRFGGLPYQVPAQPALGGAQDDRAGGAHRATLGRSGQPEEDQEQRWHHHESGLLRHFGQEAEAGELVDDPVQDRDEEREQDAEEHAEHDEVGAVRFGIAHHEPAEDAAENEEHQQRNQPAAAVVFAEADRLRRQAGRRLREYQGNEERVNGVKTGKNQSGNEGALVHVADRLAELVCHHDQHQRRRYDLGQRTGSRDDAGSHATVVAVAQHDRQRDQAHRDHGGRDHARGGRKQRADKHHGIGEAAADSTEQLPDGVEQILRHARSFEHQSHERKERNSQQRVVAHHAVDTLGKRLQEIGVELSELDADEGIDQPHSAQRERRRITEQQHDDQ